MEKVQELPSKQYYSITEVAEYFKLNASALRHWESEFKHIRPQTNAKGNRRYTRQNIDDIALIVSLVKHKGYTLQGAREYIASKEDNRKQIVIEKLQKVRTFLLDMKQIIKNEV